MHSWLTRVLNCCVSKPVQEHFGRGEGGAIHNKGRIVVNGEVEMSGNSGGVRD